MPAYSEEFILKWFNDSLNKVSPEDYVFEFRLKDGRNFIDTYCGYLRGCLRFCLYDDGLTGEITDLARFNAVTGMNYTDASQQVLIKTLTRQQERAESLRKRIIALLPEIAPSIENIIIKTSYSIPLNAGAMPTPNFGSAIILNEGIVNVPLYIKKAMEGRSSAPEQVEEFRNQVYEQMKRHAIKTGLDVETLKKIAIDIVPEWSEEEMLYKNSEACLMAFEILNRKAVPLDFIRRRSLFSKKREGLVIGPLEGDTFLGDKTAVDVIEPFILLHEIGHVLLGHTETIRHWIEHPPQSVAEYEERLKKSLRMEFEADEFSIIYLLQLNDNPVVFTASGILRLFELLAFSEIDFEKSITKPALREKVYRTLGINYHNAETQNALKLKNATHPPALQRLHRIYTYLKTKEVVASKEEANWWKSLSWEEQVRHMATTGKGGADYDDFTMPDANDACTQVFHFVNFCWGALVKRISEMPEQDKVLFSAGIGEGLYHARNHS